MIFRIPWSDNCNEEFFDQSACIIIDDNNWCGSILCDFQTTQPMEAVNHIVKTFIFEERIERSSIYLSLNHTSHNVIYLEIHQVEVSHEFWRCNLCMNLTKSHLVELLGRLSHQFPNKE